ncbi:MAG: hydroxyethylthiazole kinase [Bacteroidota bacterium]
MNRPQDLWALVTKVRTNSPLVHNITNYVVMNNTANALLAAGASPIMSHAEQEVQDMVNISGALVVNIGTLSPHWVQAMDMAVKKAAETATPWVLDPVGAGATPYRNAVLADLMEAAAPTVIRGNASEIRALRIAGAKTKGVDSTHSSEEATEAAKSLNADYGSVVCISGATDIVVSGDQMATLSNGDSMMGRVTGMGCSASALIGAFLAIEPDAFAATTAAMALMGVVGTLAAGQAQGPGSFQVALLDQLYQVTEEQFLNTLKVSYAKGEKAVFSHG